MLDDIEPLRRRHASLEAELTVLERYPDVNRPRIREIKAEKLRIKDRIAAAQRASARSPGPPQPWMAATAAEGRGSPASA